MAGPPPGLQQATVELELTEELGQAWADVELGDESAPLRGGPLGDSQLSCGGTHVVRSPRSMPQLGRLASPPPSPGRLVQAFGAASPSYLEFDVEPLAGEPDKAVFESAGKAASRSGVFNMTASALSPRAASVPLLPPAGGTMLQRGAHPGPPPLSTGACSDDAEAGAAAEPPAQAAAQARSPLALMAAPMQVPVGSVLFSVASCVLALTFFVLFLAHNDRWEETGCVLLLTAASAAAGPATLTLTAVRDPATLVCLGQEQDGPLVTEDSLQSLLAAHPAAFKDARAQLSFTPAGAAGRWGISLDVQGLAFNATAGTAVVQVENWESAAAADAGTTYPGTEAFEAQFGSGAPLGAPLLVFRVDEGLKEGLAGGYQRGGKPDEEDEDDG